MSRQRTVIRAIAIGVQWICLTTALGSLVMRADPSFQDLISPHLGAAPVFGGVVVAALLLGLTVESPRILVPLVLLMCFVAASFVGVLSYAPVVDGVLLRTTGLDNYVSQRVLLMTLILVMGAIPGAVAGNLLGMYLNVRQEIAPQPDSLAESDEVPWWERRHGTARENQHTP